ncbi:hypothetical protein R4Z10_01385 [Niallia sp. XMNu-256]|uniref:hypothetical protein n=1 Tax=Niallia sp. XMNu-256 TaxID=3082444 RepID=UPI0030D287AE
MNPFARMLTATKTVGAIILTIGIATFLYGMIVNDYVFISGIGVGAVMGAVFIFIISMFLIAAEEMLTKSKK